MNEIKVKNIVDFDNLKHVKFRWNAFLSKYFQSAYYPIIKLFRCLICTNILCRLPDIISYIIKNIFVLFLSFFGLTSLCFGLWFPCVFLDSLNRFSAIYSFFFVHPLAIVIFEILRTSNIIRRYKLVEIKNKDYRVEAESISFDANFAIDSLFDKWSYS